MTLDSEPNLSLSLKITQYIQKTENCPPYDEIEKELLELTYLLPVKYCGMDCEDAAEFTLFMYSSLPSIIASYDISKGYFEAYFYKIISHQVRYFYAKRSKKKQKEDFIAKHQATEYFCSFYTGEKKYEKDHDVVQRLCYVLKHSFVSRKRFFTLFISLSPFMEIDAIYSICKIFNIDLVQTLKITEHLSDICAQTIEQIESIKRKRNLYYSRYLVLEQSQSSEDSERALEWVWSRNKDIAEIQKRVGLEKIALLFNLSPGTVSNTMFYARNLLRWVINPLDESLNCDLVAIRRDLYEFVCSNGHSARPKIKADRSVFYPMKEFPSLNSTVK